MRFACKLSGQEFPKQGWLHVGPEWVRVKPGDVPDPHRVFLWNMAGAGLERYPSEEQAAKIAASVLLVAFRDKVPRLSLHPAKAGEQPMGGAAWFPLLAGEEIWLQSETDIEIPVRYVVAG